VVGRAEALGGAHEHPVVGSRVEADEEIPANLLDLLSHLRGDGAHLGLEEGAVVLRDVDALLPEPLLALGEGHGLGGGGEALVLEERGEAVIAVAGVGVVDLAALAAVGVELEVDEDA